MGTMQPFLSKAARIGGHFQRWLFMVYSGDNPVNTQLRGINLIKALSRDMYIILWPNLINGEVLAWVKVESEAIPRLRESTGFHQRAAYPSQQEHILYIPYFRLWLGLSQASLTHCLPLMLQPDWLEQPKYGLGWCSLLKAPYDYIGLVVRKIGVS